MKSKITLSTLSSILALATMTMTAFSQHATFSAAQNMGATLNSSATDATPVISPSGLSLYLATARPGGLGGNDIWVSQRPTLNSAWGAPQHLGPTLNSSSADAIGSLSLDGRAMFFTKWSLGRIWPKGHVSFNADRPEQRFRLDNACQSRRASQYRFR